MQEQNKIKNYFSEDKIILKIFDLLNKIIKI